MSDYLATTLGEKLASKGYLLATAESCTGGGIAHAVTDIAGSSNWFDRAFVTYSNEAKQEMLGVKPALIIEHGAVSEQVVLAMVKGALAKSRANIAVAVSGIAGPGGGTKDKPVGTVWFAFATKAGVNFAVRQRFAGDRAKVREQCVDYALRRLARLALV